MFGIAVANLSCISDAEKVRYQSLYCGLCMSLKKQYGQAARASLSYELTFLAMLYASLYEPNENAGETHCIAHPSKKVPYAITDLTDYCAGLSVGLAYHKCLDDVADEKSTRGHIGSAALKSAYRKACKRLPEHMLVIDETMQAIRALEADPDASPDSTSIAFGEMLAFLVECIPGYYPDIWTPTLREFGLWLGRFILLMDAAVDIEDDRKAHAYNPFLMMSPSPTPEEMRDILSDPIGRACQAFERLPLVQDDHLMRSVLYSGVWQKFNRVYS